MRASRGRLAVLIGGSSLSSVGWGVVLPYLYADIATARGLGAGAAAVTYTAYALGSLAAAPVAGRLADRSNPVAVAALARVAFAAAVVALGIAPDAPAVWLAAAVVGACSSVTQPAIQVLLLAWTPEARRRDVFAWQFIALNLALAAGGLVGGFVVDLSSAAGARPIFYLAAVGALASAVAVFISGRGIRTTPVDVAAPAELGYRELLRRRPIRWLLAVTVLLTLACYAQYESGLPAYALDSLHVSPKVLGTAVAINAVLVALLTGPVVAATKRFSPTVLLASCAGIWILCWAVLGVPMLAAGFGTAAVVIGYASFSFGETVLAPVLSPLAASLAPEGATGRTLASVTGATTAANAAGPALSGAILALHLPAGFIALQLACCVVAIGATRRLGILASREAVQPAVRVG